MRRVIEVPDLQALSKASRSIVGTILSLGLCVLRCLPRTFASSRPVNKIMVSM